jgi:hypothetical protein
MNGPQTEAALRYAHPQCVSINALDFDETLKILIPHSSPRDLAIRTETMRGDARAAYCGHGANSDTNRNR